MHFEFFVAFRSITAALAACILATSFASPAAAQSCVPAPSGLTNWWTGDGVVTDIPGGRNATLQNGATYGTGQVGQAFQLDGSDDYVEVAHHASLEAGTADFSVDLWARFNDTDGEQVLIEKWDDGVSGWTLTKLGSNQLHFATTGGSPTSSPQTIPTNTWIHFAVRRSGTSAAIFMNGVQIASGTVAANFNSASSLKMGRRGDPRGFFLNGRIDEVHLFLGTALSAMQIQAIYNAGSGGLCNGVCGDGTAQGMEECDDGNMVGGDGCDNDCTLSCGNSVTDAGEQCDDGNTTNGDGCDNNCTTSACGNGQSGGSEACDDGNMVNTDACKNDCTPNVCGDGSAHTGVEACDDGNATDGDGCDNNCTATACGNGIATAGEACDDGNASNLDACKNDCSANVCGDAFPRTGVEACDDGNGVNGDGCDTDCSISCGNGVVSAPEACDDSNTTDGDGCDSNCTLTACGNGIRTGAEACDDGNASDNDACKNGCTTNVCGDGAVFTGQETCDDGNVLDGDGCDSDCTVSGPCAPAPVDLTSWWIADGSGADIQGGHDAVTRNGATFAVGRARLAFSLDGVNDFVDVADDPAIDVTTGDFTVDLWVRFNNTSGEQVMVEKWVESFNDTSSGWTLTKLSGDSVRFATANGNADTRRLTLPVDTWIHFAARRSAGILAIFMGGTKVAEEEAIGDLSSPSSLKFGHRGSPLDTPGSLDTRGFYLNGRIDEVHLVNGRALSDAEIQAIVVAGRSGLCVPTPICGNALVEAGEACDDGNATDGDGCDDDCLLSCGNGAADPGEACDDGNNVSGDGCDSNCTVSECGNGIAAGLEECEDLNAVDGDGCDNNCTLTDCGNGVRTASNDEACDDGNATDGDGCESDCTTTPVEENVAAEGTVSTDPPSPQNPIQTSLKLGAEAGVVSIRTSDQPLTPATVQALIEDLLIEAPPASADDPLIITLRVDASAIPPGIDLLQIALVRNGVVLAACSGAPGVASPDPCIQSRVLEGDGDVTITGLTSHASTWGVGLRGLTKGEQKCANGIAKAGSSVAKAQDKASGGCLKAALAGEEANPQSCLSADASGKIAGTKQSTIALAAAKCAPQPPFAFTGAATTNTAAQTAALALVADIFGSNLTAVVAGDAAGAKCQAATLKAVQKLFALNNQLFRDCMGAGLAGDPSLMVMAEQLATCFDGVALNTKLLKTVSKLGKTIAGKCGSDRATLLPGVCASARNPAYCLKTRVACRTCQMFNAIAGLSKDCDQLDDALTNASCS